MWSLAAERCTPRGPHSCPVAWLRASGGISVKAGQFPVLTVAAVSLLSIMGKDKCNFLCFETLNKQPAVMNKAAVEIKTEMNVATMYVCAEIHHLNNTICWPV